ncbi:MAG TPA: protein kinase [Planktothrix sp.]
MQPRRGGAEPPATPAHAFESTVFLNPGQTIEGRYRVASILGTGGMGCVYRVTDLKDGHDYALKTLSSTQVSQVAWLRLQKEAKAAQLLNHPTIIKVHEFGLIENRQPFFVMDLFPGDTVHDIIKAHGPMPLERALDVFIEVCNGLGYAHEKGVIHRDIKSSNIMVATPEQHHSQSKTYTRIVDFGIAKVLTAQEGDSLNLTRTGEIFGTPFYMSPEQCLGTALDKRSDIYSLGCVMFEALTGLPPFMGETALATMMKHQTEKAPTLKEGSLGKEFPDALERVIARMLEKDPRARYASLFDVAQDLTAIRDGQHSGKHLSSWIGRSDGSAERKLDLVHVAAIVVLAIAALIATFWLGRYTAPVPVAAAPPPPPPPQSDFGLGTDLEKMLTQDKLPRSSSNFSARLYHFPNALGTIACESSGTRIYGMHDGHWKLLGSKGSECIAEGDIIIKDFTPLALTLNLGTVDSISSINRFVDGELYNLRFPQCFTLTVQQLGSINPRNDITALNFDSDIELDDGVIVWINSHVPNLNDLVLTGTKVDTDGLLRLKSLKQLERLGASNLTNTKRLLNQLKNSTILKKISLHGCDITDDDVVTLASMKNVYEIDLGDCEKITAKGIRHLSHMEKLKNLRIDGISDGPQHLIPVLKGLHLAALQVSSEAWPPQQIAALHAAVPNIRVNQLIDGYRKQLNAFAQ